MRRRLRAYVAIILLPAAVGVTLLLLNLVILWRAGELTPLETVVATQLSEGGLYGTAVRSDTVRYKLALLRQKKPAIVTVGDSRVLGFRQQFFREPFVNLSSTVDRSQDVADLVPILAAMPELKLVIFGLEPWWASEGRVWSQDRVGEVSFGEKIKAPSLLRVLPKWASVPSELLFSGELTPEGYLTLLRGDSAFGPSPINRFGLTASYHHSGFRADGSYAYGGRLFGSQDTYLGWIDDARDGRKTCWWRLCGNPYSPKRFAQLRAAIATLKAAGKTVVTYFPPSAPILFENPAVAEEIASYAPFRKSVNKLGADLHRDYFEPSPLSDNICEYWDDIHYGEVITARIALALATAPGFDGERFFDTAALRDYVARYAGRPSDAVDDRPPGAHEVDYLRQGCTYGKQ